MPDHRPREAAPTAPRPAPAAGRPLLALLPRGETIKNFVYSGSLDDVRRALPVHVMSVVPSADIAALLGERYGAAAVTPMETTSERWPVRFQRDVLDLAHGRWLWSEAAKQRWHMRDVEARETLRARATRLTKKALALPFAHRPGLELLSASDRLLSRRLRTSDRWLEFLRGLDPRLVFDGSHIHNRISTPVVRAAQWLGVPTAAFLFSWDNLTSQGRMMPGYDWHLCWNQGIKRDLMRIYPRIAAERILVTGTPQFDFHFRPEFHWSREELCRRVGADPARPIVLYSTGMAVQMPEEPRIVEGVARALAGLGLRERPQLLVRVYPKDQTGRFDALRARRLPDVIFQDVPWIPEWLTPRFEDCALYTNTLRHAALGLNVASTVSLELAMFDRPVLNIGYDPPGVDVRPVSYARYYSFDHYKPVVDSGAVEVVSSEDALPAALRDAFERPERRAAGRRALLERFFGDTLDGRSGTRVADALVAIAGGRA